MNTFFNDVNEWLSVGGDLDLARDLTGQTPDVTIAQLLAHGVTHVLDLRIEHNENFRWIAAGVPETNVLSAPIDDRWGYIPKEEWFATIEAFVHKYWMESLEGERLYVHCHMGINRAPSAAMLALLTVDPLLAPMDAFMMIRRAREAAGLVYGESVGIRHLLNVEQCDPEVEDLPASVHLFSTAIRNYWTPELRRSVSQGIAFYRDHEGGTLRVGLTR